MKKDVFRVLVYLGIYQSLSQALAKKAEISKLIRVKCFPKDFWTHVMGIDFETDSWIYMGCDRSWGLNLFRLR